MNSTIIFHIHTHTNTQSTTDQLHNHKMPPKSYPPPMPASARMPGPYGNGTTNGPFKPYGPNGQGMEPPTPSPKGPPETSPFGQPPDAFFGKEVIGAEIISEA